MLFALQTLGDNLTLVLTILYLIIIFGWLKQQLGSSIISLIISIGFIWLVFLRDPMLVWIPIVLFLFSFFFRGLFDKIPVGEKRPDFLRD